MRAVISVVGKDQVGILAKVSSKCAEYRANIVDVTQTILQDLFAMVMLADITELNCEFGVLSEALTALGQEMSLQIHVMHEDIFNHMHRI
jgi:ACT domain-containing protein